MIVATTTHRVALCAGAVLFCLLAILNSGGYRYGIGDQAFYVPAVVQHIDASLFPRDRALLHVQDRFMAYDDVAAIIVKNTGISLPALFFAAFVVALLLLFSAAVSIGRTLYRSWWTVAMLAALLTLRHRITQTGANTLESYFQPRMLAFALGLWAIAAYLRGHGMRGLVLVAIAFFVHPTTAVWFGIWVAVALPVADRRWRIPSIALAAVALLSGLWMIAAGPLRGHLARMDPRWASVLAGKDYIFPFDWTPLFWILNLGYAVIIITIYLRRRRQNIALPREAGLVAGALALVSVFLISWLFMREWVALALQLQTSRVFWMLDVLATIYIAWWLAETPPVKLRPAIVAVVVALAAGRGLYVMLAEHRGMSIVSIALSRDNWTEAMNWIARTPHDSHVLADPGHAWKYGTSVRVAGERDVYLEEVKDVSLALYSRDVAMRVLGRIEDAHDFAQLTPDHARALAKQYDLNYLVLDHDIDLPIVYRNDRFRIYSLDSR